MSGDDDAGNLFAVPDFFRPSIWTEDGASEAGRRFFHLELTGRVS